MAATQASRRSEPTAEAFKFTGTPTRVGEERFKLTALPLGKGGQESPLEDITTAFNWTDQSAESTGSVQLQDNEGKVKFAQGQIVACEWMPMEGQPWRSLWRLAIQTPEAQLQAKSTQLTLESSLTKANKSTDNYSFRKDRGHPHGWTCDEIARAVSKRSGIPIGQLSKGTTRINNLVMHAAKPLDVIIRAYTAERHASNRLFFIYWNGWVNVLPLVPSSELLEFASAIMDAALKEALRADFATAVTVRGSVRLPSKTGKGKGRTTKKVLAKVQSAEGIRTYGYIHKEVIAPDAQTAAQARKFGENYLAKAIKPERTLTVTIPIRPELKRGMAFQIDWASQGVTQVCYIAGLSHQVSPGHSTTEVTAQFTSPFTEERAKLDKEAREKKAKERGRSSKSSPPATSTGAQAKRRS